MIILGIVFAVLLCGVTALASYLHLLYVHSMRFRPRETLESVNHFEQKVQPLLRFEPQEGLSRYALARQAALILLALNLAALAFEQRQTYMALGEVLFLAIAGMVLFAHIIPGVLLSRTSGHWLTPLVGMARLIAWVIHPLLILIRFASSVAELSAEEPPADDSRNPTEDITALLDVGEEEGLIGNDDRKLIQSVVEFGDKTVREVVTPRPRIVSIHTDCTVDELWRLLIENDHSRIPVYGDDIDDIQGLVHTRDTLDIDEAESKRTTVKELMRPVAFVPETKPIRELLREMQQKNAQMSIVVDEYGQTAGLVTMEDLMEEIVGEIRDESDSAADVVEQPDHSFVVDGNLDLDRLEELVGFRPDQEFESTTIGGLVCEQMGQVPPAGAKMTLDGIQLEVLAADQRHISSVKVRRLPSPSQEDQTVPEPSPSERETA